MTFLDISVPLWPGMPVYEGDPVPRMRRIASLAAGGICNLSGLDFGLHSGTHIDAPLHFIDGASSVEATPLEALIGPAFVADATSVDGHIDEEALASLRIPPGVERLLFKTRNSALWRREGFSRNYQALTEGAAKALVRRGIRLAGIDYLSIAPFGDPAPVHLALLQAGTVILEGLDLASVERGRYQLLCLPLLIAGADGAPARALLRAPARPASGRSRRGEMGAAQL